MTFDLPANYSTLDFLEKRLVREQYITTQSGLCWHCKEPLKRREAKHVSVKYIDKRLFPTGFFDYPIHLHHDHDTGLTVGAVHCYCNAVLWCYHGQ